MSRMLSSYQQVCIPDMDRVPFYCAKVFHFTVFLHPTAVVSPIILIINIIIQGRNSNSFKQCLSLLITSNIEKHKKMVEL